MIHLPCFFIALLLVGASAKYKIDLTSCKAETECYLLNKCMISTEAADRFNLWNNMGAPNESCHFILQRRFFTDDKTLYFIQIQNKTLQTKKIELFYGDDSLLSCQKNVTTNEITVTTANPQLQAINPTPYEDYSYFNSDSALCAFTVEKIEKLTTLNENLKLTIRFDREIYKYNIDGPLIFSHIPGKIRCDPDSIGDLSYSHGFHILPIRFKERLLLNCKHYKSELGVPYDYNLYVELEENVPVMVENLKCSKRGSYLFNFNNGSDDIYISDSFNAYCAVEVCKTLTETPLNCTKDCPHFKLGNNEQFSSYNCTNGKWFIDNKYYEEIQPICKPNEENEPMFFMSLPDQPEKELKEGQCFEKYDCITHSKLDISECNEENTGCGKIVVGEELYCNASMDDFDLIIYSGRSMLNELTKFKCNPETGLFASSTNPSVTIPISSRVVCRRKPGKLAEKQFSRNAVIGYGFTAFFIGAIVASLLMLGIYFIVFKKRKQIVEKIQETIVDKKARWMQLSPDERKFATHGVILKSTESNDGILHTLKFIEMVLDCSTEEPEIWEPLEVFLRKFQAASLSKDRLLQKAFNRYCYLQAKRIIDKHGWISPNPITKTNFAGYIRVVAIKFLAIARRDDVDAQKMILEGFKTLRFNAVEQYPHCGLLWALVTQQRVGMSLLHRKLIDLLPKMCPEDDIPEDDRFYYYGSVKNQVYFAIGASDMCYTFHMAYKAYDTRDVSLMRSYVLGTFYCTSGNTTDSCYQMMRMFKESIIKETDAIDSTGKSTKDDEEEGRKVVRKKGPNGFDPSPSSDISNLIENLTELDRRLTTMVFQRRFRAAKDLENWYLDLTERKRTYADKKKAKDENREWKEKHVYDTAAEKAAKLRPNEPRRGKTPSYYEVKAVYRVYMEQLEIEHESLLKWMSEKLGKEEMKKLSKSSKDPTSMNSSVTSNPIQGRENSSSGDNFIDQFVGSFYKERSFEKVTTCPVPEKDQTKLREMLQRIFSEKTILGEQVLFSPVEVIDVFDKIIPIISSEPIFIEDVPAGITVVGDLHGQIFDLARIFETSAVDGKQGYETGKYLFLGDYADRGTTILEVVLAVYILKILYPDRFWLLRGNHEFLAQNWHTGTMQEIEFIYGKSAAEFIFYKLNESFAYLSICAVVGGEIFCAHGGISASPMTRHELRLICKPIAESSFDILVNDMVWSDPTKGADGFFYNDNRGCSIYYGEDFLEKTLEELECTSLIRGHQMMTKGYAKPWPCLLLVFSATAQSAIYEIIVLKEDKERNEIEANIGKEKPVKEEVTMREERDKIEGGGGKDDIGSGEMSENMEAE
ncbi:hypothetical protein PRIPAC_75816 [Pristionchus pacificus]|uniref:Serine/threonine-protein phosphatase n=1 Tax=Pristionchus pacificus TaxID=54126 RepID=A0A2A6CS86_PRIPA|nr:hypothetical protein PRIPAC_75816 [Pristionchus pacificus]|eukprot:PDM80968.1 Calcineurin-like phosphoesterase [Pristionchus pacificus]